MLRILTAGESHGPAEIAIIEGLPAGLSISADYINHELQRRRADFGRGGRGQIEQDKVEILSGIRGGKTLGSPITLLVRNADFANWQDVMGIEETALPLEKVTRPRPGHADLAGVLKYGTDDIRNVSERASARETIMRVAAGAVVKQLLNDFGIKLASHTVQIGTVKLTRAVTFEEAASVFETDPEIRCVEPEISAKMKAVILNAAKKRDTLGGIVEVIACGVPPGLGSVMHYDRRLDGLITGALMSIPSVKAVEIGNGIAGAAMFGSEFHDCISYRNGQFCRDNNNSGGIDGGISNGEDIVCRVYHKPIPTLGNPLATADIITLKTAPGVAERSDICAVPRAGVISEAMLAVILGNALIEKFGGDSINDMKYNFAGYKKAIIR